MAQSVSLQSSSFAARLLFGFIAGFVATLIFHQIGLLLLHFVGMTPNMPYNMNSVPPFGVPQFISLSFWGGVWGIIFVSVDYRMLPQQDALAQADDVARALAFAQSRARSWGGDPGKFILMGHSAGAHLVALLAAAILKKP